MFKTHTATRRPALVLLFLFGTSIFPRSLALFSSTVSFEATPTTVSVLTSYTPDSALRSGSTSSLMNGASHHFSHSLILTSGRPVIPFGSITVQIKAPQTALLPLPSFTDDESTTTLLEEPLMPAITAAWDSATLSNTVKQASAISDHTMIITPTGSTTALAPPPVASTRNNIVASTSSKFVSKLVVAASTPTGLTTSITRTSSALSVDSSTSSDQNATPPVASSSNNTTNIGLPTPTSRSGALKRRSSFSDIITVTVIAMVAIIGF